MLSKSVTKINAPNGVSPVCRAGGTVGAALVRGRLHILRNAVRGRRNEKACAGGGGYSQLLRNVGLKNKYSFFQCAFVPDFESSLKLFYLYLCFYCTAIKGCTISFCSLKLPLIITYHTACLTMPRQTNKIYSTLRNVGWEVGRVAEV